MPEQIQMVNVPRDEIPVDTGILCYYLRLASQAVFRKGFARYCGRRGAVRAGSWIGGIVSLKSILRVKSRREALGIMDELQTLKYITHTIEADTRKLTYCITDWVIECSGKECPDGNVYTTPTPTQLLHAQHPPIHFTCSWLLLGFS